MRIIIIFIFVILAAAGIYTGYSILTFEPVQPAPLVFKEPDAEVLKQLVSSGKDKLPEMSASEKAQSQAAVDKIGEALTIYQGYEQKATPRLAGTLAIIDSVISSGKLPAWFLDQQNKKFDMLKFDPTNVVVVQQPKTSVSCVGPTTSVMIGDNGENAMDCAAPAADNDQIFLSGPGNDTIVDVAGNRIVNAGSGDDTITLGPGRSIVVLEDGWGHDTLKVDCTGATVVPSNIPPGFPVPWLDKYTNFIVLSPRIQPEAVKWDATGKILTNTASGDTLTVSENCFNVVGVK